MRKRTTCGRFETRSFSQFWSRHQAAQTIASRLSYRLTGASASATENASAGGGAGRVLRHVSARP